MKRARGKAMYPPPVACARFAGGESIRMSFWQPSGKPWRVEPVKAWLCRIIGEERGVARPQVGQRLAKVRALAERPGTPGEQVAALAAMQRIDAVLETYRGRKREPATDILDFWVEHDGKRVDLAAAQQKALPARKPRLAAVKPVALPAPVDDRATMLLRQLVDAAEIGSVYYLRTINSVISDAREYLRAA